jgi:hypothetical protein
MGLQTIKKFFSSKELPESEITQRMGEKLYKLFIGLRINIQNIQRAQKN